MSKRILIIGGALLFVVLLAGAAFVGGQLLNGQGLSGLGLAGGPGSKPGANVNVIQPAKELPQTAADASGLFDHRKDNSIFVGPNPVRMGVSVRRLLQTPSSDRGPSIEVVFSPQSIVYKDVTEQQYNGPPPSGQKIQQEVEPGRIEEIGEGSVITAWGKKTGDRIIADVLVYTRPPVMNAEP